MFDQAECYDNNLIQKENVYKSSKRPLLGLMDQQNPILAFHL